MYFIDLKNKIPSQDEIQNILNDIYLQKGLPQTIEALEKIELELGYLKEEMFGMKDEFIFFDKEFNLNFRLQINYVRNNYKPVPLSPNLHCPICYENIGTKGKEYLRVFKFLLNNREVFIQLTPFPLFRHHYVLIEMEKNPMRMDKNSIIDLIEFLNKTDESFVCCSNSDVEWAGASILKHHHYQIFKDLDLPVFHAKFLLQNEYNDFKIEILNYPIAVVKIISPIKERIINIGGEIIEKWKNIFPGQNTCNLILKKLSNNYQCYIFLRNPNYRTSTKWQQFKSEGVGIIEVSGEIILPVPDSEEKKNFIKNNGLEIIKGIISSNSPFEKNEYKQIYHDLIGFKTGEKNDY